jgi:pyruvate,orthophosphate dikinase
MLDLEFTVQDGKLFMLRTRVGKRTAVAALRIAVGWWKKIYREKPPCCASIRSGSSSFAPDGRSQRSGAGMKGLPASPGAAVGQWCSLLRGYRPYQRGQGHSGAAGNLAR